MTVVAMLILTVVGVGVAVVLPRHTAWWLLHYTLTAWLIFNIAFNYLATLIRDPGQGPAFPNSPSIQQVIKHPPLLWFTIVLLSDPFDLLPCWRTMATPHWCHQE